MKLTVERGALLKALGHAASVVERRNTIPVLANVLVEARGEALLLIATDLNLQISLEIPARIEVEGATTVGAHLLHDIARELADGSQIDLALTDGKLHVAADRSRFKVPVLPRDDFPALPPPKDGYGFSVSATALATMLGRTAFAISDEISRPYLHGVQVEERDGELVAAATNGHCLASARLPAPEGSKGLTDAILPGKLVAQLQRLTAEAEGDVQVAINESRAAFTIGGALLIGKLLDASFPDWRRAVPTANGQRLLIARESFTAAVRRARVIANEKTRAVRIDLTRDKLTVSVTSPDSSHAAEEAPAAWDQADFTTVFNSRYLLDTFAAMGGEELQADLADAAAPALFTNPADSSAQWVVMPMRV